MNDGFSINNQAYNENIFCMCAVPIDATIYKINYNYVKTYLFEKVKLKLVRYKSRFFYALNKNGFILWYEKNF